MTCTRCDGEGWVVGYQGRALGISWTRGKDVVRRLQFGGDLDLKHLRHAGEAGRRMFEAVRSYAFEPEPCPDCSQIGEEAR